MDGDSIEDRPVLDCGHGDTQRPLFPTGNSMRECEANTFARSRGEMHTLWISWANTPFWESGVQR
jgi:hypothetical protein